MPQIDQLQNEGGMVLFASFFHLKILQNVWMFMPTQDLQSLRMTPVAWSIYSCKDRTTRTTPICHHLRLAGFIANKNYLLCSQKYHDQEFRTCLGRLKANGLLRYRGAQCSQGEKPYASQRPIPCRITCSELGKQPQTSSIAIHKFDKPGRAVN